MTYDCMTPDELAAWLEAARQVRGGGRTPCVDCPWQFALEARRQGCCVGRPGGVGRPRFNANDPDVARRRLQWRTAQQRRRRRKMAVRRTKEWKAQLRDAVEAVRAARYNDECSGSELSVPTLRPGPLHS